MCTNCFERAAMQLWNQADKIAQDWTGSARTSSQWGSISSLLCTHPHSSEVSAHSSQLEASTQAANVCLHLLVCRIIARAALHSQSYLPSLHRLHLNWFGSSFTLVHDQHKIQPSRHGKPVIWSVLPPQISCPSFWLHSSHLMLVCSSHLTSCWQNTCLLYIPLASNFPRASHWENPGRLIPPYLPLRGPSYWISLWGRRPDKWPSLRPGHLCPCIPSKEQLYPTPI